MAAARNVGQPRLEVKESDSRRDQPPDSKLVQQLSPACFSAPGKKTIPDLVRRQLHKTRLCPYHSHGRCVRGIDCSFAHSAAELREMPDLRFTRLCDAIKFGGTCHDNNCTFAHDRQVLRITDPKLYKVRLCNFNKKGKCLNGAYCRFAHGAIELRAPVLSKSGGELDSDGVQSVNESLDSPELSAPSSPLATAVSSVPVAVLLGNNGCWPRSLPSDFHNDGSRITRPTISLPSPDQPQRQQLSPEQQLQQLQQLLQLQKLQQQQEQLQQQLQQQQQLLQEQRGMAYNAPVTPNLNNGRQTRRKKQSRDVSVAGLHERATNDFESRPGQGTAPNLTALEYGTAIAATNQSSPVMPSILVVPPRTTPSADNGETPSALQPLPPLSPEAVVAILKNSCPRALQPEVWNVVFNVLLAAVGTPALASKLPPAADAESKTPVSRLVPQAAATHSNSLATAARASRSKQQTYTPGSIVQPAIQQPHVAATNAHMQEARVGEANQEEEEEEEEEKGSTPWGATTPLSASPLRQGTGQRQQQKAPHKISHRHLADPAATRHSTPGLEPAETDLVALLRTAIETLQGNSDASMLPHQPSRPHNSKEGLAGPRRETAIRAAARSSRASPCGWERGGEFPPAGNSGVGVFPVSEGVSPSWLDGKEESESSSALQFPSPDAFADSSASSPPSHVTDALVALLGKALGANSSDKRLETDELESLAALQDIAHGYLTPQEEHALAFDSKLAGVKREKNLGDSSVSGRRTIFRQLSEDWDTLGNSGGVGSGQTSGSVLYDVGQEEAMPRNPSYWNRVDEAEGSNEAVAGWIESDEESALAQLLSVAGLPAHKAAAKPTNAPQQRARADGRESHRLPRRSPWPLRHRKSAGIASDFPTPYYAEISSDHQDRHQ
eukprot:GHVT01094893.1.p1 GENE.GHVT01094893.1~~GHVT01094893.1.p1  ORF type:complete len:897 (-),score=236.22 GHVT01094893.1:579-3269(-)